jgi:predicted GTPase
MDEIILNTFRDSMNDTKDRIIKLKMDTLFNYVSEAASGKIFTRKIDEYNKDSKIYKDELDKHNELYNNPHTQELIKTKTETIHELNRSIRGMLSEYATTDNKNILTTVIETYKNDLLPEVENLRRLKYDIMEMNHIIVEGRPPVSVLFQSEVAMSKREYVYGEKPSVLKFVV